MVFRGLKTPTALVFKSAMEAVLQEGHSWSRAPKSPCREQKEFMTQSAENESPQEMKAVTMGRTLMGTDQRFSAIPK